VAVHEKGAPPVLETVKVVWAATQVWSWMVVGTTVRVGGMGVAVGEALAVGDLAGDGEAAGVLVVLGGFPPGPPARVTVGAPEAEEALLFAAALLFEEADGATTILNPPDCTSAYSRRLSRMHSASTPSPGAPRSQRADPRRRWRGCGWGCKCGASGWSRVAGWVVGVSPSALRSAPHHGQCVTGEG
jgi:hypothetical protein